MGQSSCPSSHLAIASIIATILLQWHANAFQVPVSTAICHQQLGRHQQNNHGFVLHDGANDDNGGNAAAAAADEAEQLFAKARAIRESLKATPGADDDRDASSSKMSPGSAAQVGKIVSEFSLQSPQSVENGYRLYLDIGREPGTWMDPRWGASGRRIECTLDVAFAMTPAEDDSSSVSDEIAAGLIKTVTNKSSSLSRVYHLISAPRARLRGGFDKMAINDGGFCIESSPSASLSSSSTLRFCISVDGAVDGDVTIPGGNLYFALPYFGTSMGMPSEDGDNAKRIMNLSNKEGTITVKQMGWHTGWRREESRILGVFRAVPLGKARERDKF